MPLAWPEREHLLPSVALSLTTRGEYLSPLVSDL